MNCASHVNCCAATFNHTECVWNSRKRYGITVRCMKSPSGVWNHRQVYGITVRRIESPSGVWNHRQVYGIKPSTCMESRLRALKSSGECLFLALFQTKSHLCFLHNAISVPHLFTVIVEVGFRGPLRACPFFS